MTVATFLTFWGGGENDSGPGGGIIIFLFLAFLVGVPAVVGLLLRRRDRRRGDTGHGSETTTKNPPSSPVFDGWGRDKPFDFKGQSTPRDWMLVGALSAALLLAYLVTQL